MEKETRRACQLESAQDELDPKVEELELDVEEELEENWELLLRVRSDPNED
jgi:hypothetical protein